jgi:hypothetical protein
MPIGFTQPPDSCSKQSALGVSEARTNLLLVPIRVAARPHRAPHGISASPVPSRSGRAACVDTRASTVSPAPVTALSRGCGHQARPTNPRRGRRRTMRASTPAGMSFWPKPFCVADEARTPTRRRGVHGRTHRRRRRCGRRWRPDARGQSPRWPSTSGHPTPGRAAGVRLGPGRGATSHGRRPLREILVPTPCQVTTIAAYALTEGPEIYRLVKWASSLPPAFGAKFVR